jgi:hypothetical protein
MYDLAIFKKYYLVSRFCNQKPQKTLFCAKLNKNANYQKFTTKEALTPMTFDFVRRFDCLTLHILLNRKY